MIRRLGLLLIIGGLSLTPLADQNTREKITQSREEKVRQDKKQVEAAGTWIYNDLPKAFAEAKQSGKPLVVVLRCIPCVECVKLDDELIDADAKLQALLAQFVRVRVVSTNGLDLSLFQYDTDQSFAVFLLNADGTIYGRFGTRSHRTDWIGDVSVEGLSKALQGALALHREYPQNKSALAAKRGPAPEFTSPEQFPSLKDKYKTTLDYEGQVVQSCIHCHQIGDAARQTVFSRHEKLSDTLLFPYPHPKTIGLVLDPKEMATVLSVVPNSDAAKAGFQPDDVITRLAGQPLLSIADVQWVLQSTSPDGADVTAEVLRAGKPVQLKIKLPKGWRAPRYFVAPSTWGLRRHGFGGMLLANLADEDRQALKLPKDSLSLRVQHVGTFAPHNAAHQAGVRKGDVLVSFDGRTDLLRETDLLAYALRDKKPGEKVELTVLRNGAKQTLNLTLPE